MKSPLTQLLFGLLALASGVAQAAPLGTAFTYQGRLDQNGQPATGLYHMTFWLYAAVSGGNPIASNSVLAVPVNGGLFSTNVDFGSNRFAGEERWMAITVATNGSSAFTLIQPRTRLAPTPNAIYASTAGAVPSGAIGAGQLATTGRPAAGQVLGYNGSSLEWQAPGSGPWFVNGSSAYYPGGNVGIGTATPQALLDVRGGAALSGSLSFGSQVRQMLNLWAEEYAVGVQAATLYQRTGGAFAWHKSGSHVDAYADPGPGGSTLMTLDDYFVSVRGLGNERTYFGGDGNGDVQIGSHNPAVTLVALWNTAYGGLMDLVGRDFSYVGLQNKLDVADNFIATVRAADLLLGHSSRRGTPGRALVDFGSELHLNFASDWASTVIGGNNVSVCTLTIRGGCDLAEPFPMKEEAIDKGSVVVIDHEHAGRLKRSTHAYDKRVAGIVSGANGIHPGIALTQEGVLDQGENVALTGRVYVKADASFGEIEPGDLLTTSDTPGHAMKVSDSARAQGAILGKAMSALKEGTGLVLVLVTLQ